MINSDINKKAWQIRKAAAKKLCCKVMEVSWKHCLRLARSLNLKKVNSAVSSLQYFDNIGDIIRFCNEKNVRPVLKSSKHPGVKIIVDYFDTIMILAGNNKRAKIV